MNPKPPPGFTLDEPNMTAPSPPEGFVLDSGPSPIKSIAGVSNLPSMPEGGPAVRPVPIEQMKIHSMLDTMPSPISEEVKKRAIEMQRAREYGTITSGSAFSVSNAIKNIPRNVEEIARDFGSLLMGLGRMAKNAVLDREELNRQVKPAADLITAIKKDWISLFAGETPKELGKLPAGQAMERLFEKVERQGLVRTGLKFIEDRPIDALLIGQAGKSALGAGVRFSAEGAAKVIPKGTKIGDSLERFLSTERTPIVFELPAERQVTRELRPGEVPPEKPVPLKERLRDESGEVAVKLKTEELQAAAVPEAGAGATPRPPGTITETVTEPVKTIEFPREYAKDPLTKYIYQKSFDKVLDTFPGVKKMLAERKANTFIDRMRRNYDQANFRERVALQNEVMREIEKLTPAEQAFVVPYLEGRVSLAGKPSEELLAFEKWYRDLSDTIQKDLSRMGALEPEQVKARLYQPLTKATGRTIDEITAEFGDFTPAYVHHTFPKTFLQKMGTFFADTTGKRYMPGFLKRSQGVEGYTENLKEILPKWTAEYVKYKNTEAFLNDFTTKLGVPVNIKDVRNVEGGLQVKGKTYRGYRIVAPDGFLNFYRGKIDFYKEVSRRLEGMDFDEAIGSALMDALQGAGKNFMGVSKNRIVYLVPENIAKRLESYATPLFGSQRAQNVVKLVYDKPVQLWKDTVLAASPRWIKNNVIGDIIFNTAEGVGPLSYGRAFSAKYHDLIPDELLRASFANTMKYNPQLGLAARSTIGGLAQAIEDSRAVKGISKIKDMGYALNTMFEQPFVRALYVKLARENATDLLKKARVTITEENILSKMAEIKNTPALKEKIVAKVEKTLPVFDLTGNFERKYMKRLMPFYNWYKFMAKYAATLPANHPFLTVGARGLGALSEVQREQAFKQMFPFMAREIDEGGVPDRYDNLWPIKGPDAEGKAVFFNSRGLNVFTTVEDMLKGDLVNMFSPIIKVPIERSLGQAAFTGQEFRTGERGVDFKSFEKEAPPLGEHILRQFPQYELLKQTLVPARQYDTGTAFNPEPILDKITGEYKYPIDAVEKWLNFIGIDKRTLDIRKTWDAYQRQKAAAIGETFSKYQSKADTALSFEDIKGIFDQIRSDPKTWNAIIAEIKDKAQVMAKEKRELAGKLRQR